MIVAPLPLHLNEHKNHTLISLFVAKSMTASGPDCVKTQKARVPTENRLHQKFVELRSAC
jgi:hypothetical protein